MPVYLTAISLTLILLSVAILLFARKPNKTKSTPTDEEPDRSHTDRKCRKRSAGHYVAPVFCLLLTAALWGSLLSAHIRGMELNSTVQDFIKGFTVTPMEDRLPDDIGHTLIIFYRYDCNDCHQTLPAIQEALKDYPVFYINSRSTQGEALREEYPISFVPSLVYITADQKAHYSFALATIGDNGEVTLDTENLNDALLFYDREY